MSRDDHRLDAAPYIMGLNSPERIMPCPRRSMTIKPRAGGATADLRDVLRVTMPVNPAPGVTVNVTIQAPRNKIIKRVQSERIDR